jgi:hypothetical protein
MISAMPVTEWRNYKSTHDWDFEKENKLAPYPCVTCLWARRVLSWSILRQTQPDNGSYYVQTKTLQIKDTNNSKNLIPHVSLSQLRTIKLVYFSDTVS